MKKGYWLALVFAEIYSFAGLFASMSEQLKTVYPITAVFNISGYYDAGMVQVLIGIIVLLACAVLALFILKGLNRKAKSVLPIAKTVPYVRRTLSVALFLKKSCCGTCGKLFSM